MCLISVPNSKEIHPRKRLFFSWLTVTVLNRCEEEKCEENWAVLKNAYLANYLSDFLQIWYVQSVYMQGIKYVNLIEISLVVIEI